MKSFLKGIGVGFCMVMFAGCQAEGTRFELKDQRFPEQLGIRLEEIGNFGRLAELTSQPQNLPAYYLSHGELDFQVYRITNVSERTLEFYPSDRALSRSGTSVLTQTFAAGCPRTSSCQTTMTSFPSYAISEVTSEYRSEYDWAGSEWRIESGVREDLAFDSSTGSARPIQLRRGESAVWTRKFVLRKDSVIYRSAPLTAQLPAGPGRYFMPPGLSASVIDMFLHTEVLYGLRYDSSFSAEVFVRNPETDELNPLYLGKPRNQFVLFDESTATGEKISSTKTTIANRINGLAEQL